MFHGKGADCRNKSMKRLFAKLKQKHQLFVNDKFLVTILWLHLLLCVCHVAHGFMSDVEYHGYFRAAGCLLIAILIYFLGRKGLSYGLVVYACSLIYLNTFYNYGTIFFILVAIGANPSKQKPILLIYLINVIISFSLQRLLVFSAAIHVMYIILFNFCMKYVFQVKRPDKLNLTEDERMILKELYAGKKQKEIDLFSQPTITAKIKNARERNLCETTPELIAKYALEQNKNAD